MAVRINRKKHVFQAEVGKRGTIFGKVFTLLGKRRQKWLGMVVTLLPSTVCPLLAQMFGENTDSKSRHCFLRAIKNLLRQKKEKLIWLD